MNWIRKLVLITYRFQAIREDNAVESGIHTLPLILSLTVGAIAAGGAVVVIGYYTPFLILGSVFISVGCGLLYTLQPTSSTATWIGYQILVGAGIGMSMEQCNVAIQTVLPKDQIPAGISLSILLRSLSGSIAIAICQNVFEQRLRNNLSGILPEGELSIVSGSGATTLISNAQAAVGGNQDDVQKILNLYNDAVKQTFLVATVMAALTLPAALLVEWKSVKKEKKEKRIMDDKVGVGNDKLEVRP